MNFKKNENGISNEKGRARRMNETFKNKNNE